MYPRVRKSSVKKILSRSRSNAESNCLEVFFVKMLIGLGNPGAQYKSTRHNVGFMMAERLAEAEKVRMRRKMLCSSWVGFFEREGERVFIAKPRTFMNRSGHAAAALLGKYDLSISDLVIAYDDVALNLGQLRLRQNGGAGGHNGIRSIIDALGTNDFCRIRIGVGAPVGAVSMTDHVLGGFKPEEREIIDLAIDNSLDMFSSLLRNGVEQTMSVFNSKVN